MKPQHLPIQQISKHPTLASSKVTASCLNRNNFSIEKIYLPQSSPHRGAKFKRLNEHSNRTFVVLIKVVNQLGNVLPTDRK